MIVRKLLKDKKGATAIEYGLIAAIMAVALISGVGAFGKALNNQFVFIADTIDSAWK